MVGDSDSDEVLEAIEALFEEEENLLSMEAERVPRADEIAENPQYFGTTARGQVWFSRANEATNLGEIWIDTELNCTGIPTWTEASEAATTVQLQGNILSSLGG